MSSPIINLTESLKEEERAMAALIAAWEGDDSLFRNLLDMKSSLRADSLIHLHKSAILLRNRHPEAAEAVRSELVRRVRNRAPGWLRTLAHLSASEASGGNYGFLEEMLAVLPKLKRRVIRRTLSILFRESAIFRADLSGFLDPIFESAVGKLSVEEFADALSEYLRLAPYFGAAKDVVAWAGELAEDVPVDSPENLRFHASYAVALASIGDEGWREAVSRAESEWLVEPSRYSLFKTSLSLMGRAILLYSYIASEGDALRKAREIASQIYVASSYIRDAAEMAKKGRLKVEDADFYLSEVPPEEAPLLLNPRQYIRDSSLALKEAVTGVASSLRSMRMLGRNGALTEVAEKLWEASENLKLIPSADRYEAFAASASLWEELPRYEAILREMKERRARYSAYYLVGYWLGTWAGTEALHALLKLAPQTEPLLRGYVYSAYGRAEIAGFREAL